MLSLLLISVLVALPQASAQGNGYSSFNTTFSPSPVYGPSSPPFYPSPYGTGYSASGDWASAYESAIAFVKQLTLLEKVNITTGAGWTLGPCVGNTGSVPRLGLDGFCLQDAPLGVRDTDFNTVFPPLSQAAKTWDRDLVRRHGVAMGEEFKAKGANVQLGPVCGPLGTFAEGGRNWEGYTPDPWACGQFMAETVIGIQSAGTLACAKHFVGNEQEHFRQAPESNGYKTHLAVEDSISSNIDDRTMHEAYLWPFADAVRAGVGSVMCSYNQVNNSYACQNSALLNGLLKDELDFQGFVVSDWGAVHSGVATYLAGTDMLMPGDGNSFSDGYSWFGRNLTISVLNGTIPESLLNDKVVRIMAAYYKLQQNVSYPKPNFDSFDASRTGYRYDGAGLSILNQYVDVRGNHSVVAQQVAQESIILLKNNGSLPLKNVRWLNIVGNDAGPAPYGPNGIPDRGDANGTLGIGWGSGSSNYPYLTDPLSAISARAQAEGSLVYSVTDNYAYSQINTTVSHPDATSLVFISSDSGEGYISVEGNEGDRNNLTAWQAGDQLVHAVASNCNNTVVIVHSVGPITMESWVDHPNVTAIIWAGLPGQESGNSLTSVLYGDYNPSGKLTYTIAKNRSDYGQQLMYEPNAPVPQYNFTTTNIDYRHFDAAAIIPRYEFGFGLSYTTFRISPGSLTRVSNASYASRSAYPTSTPAASMIPDLNTNASAALFPSGFTRKNNFNYPNILNVSEATPSGTYPYPYSVTNDTAATFPRSPAGGGPGGNPSLYDILVSVSATVTNTGSLAGAEVAQLYVSFPNSTTYPTAPNQLRGFQKTFLQPNQTITVTFDLNRKDLSVWNTDIQNWQTLPGAYTLRVGNSSRNLQTVGTISF